MEHVVVTRLALDHFRSWKEEVFNFRPDVNILYGRNGSGKTSIVEAIHFLSAGFSPHAPTHKHYVEHEEMQATIRIKYSIGKRENLLTITIPSSGAVRAQTDGGNKVYFRTVVGSVPSVLFSPEDQLLVRGDPAGRRNLIDETAVMLSPSYYAQLQKMKTIAAQRAAVLKSLQLASSPSRLSSLEVWTAEFISIGEEITRVRLQTIRDLNRYFPSIYRTFASTEEDVSLVYQPSFDEVIRCETEEDIGKELSAHFRRLYRGETARGTNLIGPQRDDISVLLQGYNAKSFASNGEQWTLALALRMAQFSLLKEMKNDIPILILDDVFAQLDEKRRENILRFALQQGQVFITAASLGDIPQSDSDQYYCLFVGKKKDEEKEEGKMKYE